MIEKLRYRRHSTLQPKHQPSLKREAIAFFDALNEGEAPQQRDEAQRSRRPQGRDEAEATSAANTEEDSKRTGGVFAKADG